MVGIWQMVWPSNFILATPPPYHEAKGSAGDVGVPLVLDLRCTTLLLGLKHPFKAKRDASVASQAAHPGEKEALKPNSLPELSVFSVTAALIAATGVPTRGSVTFLATKCLLNGLLDRLLDHSFLIHGKSNEHELTSENQVKIAELPCHDPLPCAPARAGSHPAAHQSVESDHATLDAPGLAPRS